MSRRQPAVRRITEADFLGQVLALARLRGWRTMHQRPARTRRGWTTAVQGDGVGFPDVLMIRGPRAIVAELKVGDNQPTEAQGRWLAAFRGAGIPAYVWHPKCWAEIERILGEEQR